MFRTAVAQRQFKKKVIKISQKPKKIDIFWTSYIIKAMIGNFSSI